MKKYLPRLIIVFFFVALAIFIATLFKSCFDVHVGGLDEDKIENLKGVS